MDITNRDRLSVLQTMFTVIKDAHEYAHYDCAEDIRNYYYFIYGVLAMTETLLKEIDEMPKPTPDSHIPDKSELYNDEKMGEVSASVMEQAVGFYNTYMNAKLGE